MMIEIRKIIIHPGRRDLNPESVEKLARSIARIGLLNPITVSQDHVLIAGLHRLEAVKQLGWVKVPCHILDLGELQAELACLDENFIRNDLSGVEFNDLLLRRKELYESIHPEVRHGGDRKSSEIKTTNCRLDFEPHAKSFAEDTAEVLGVSPRTVQRQIQTAKNLTEKAKEILRDSDTPLTKQTTMALSRLNAEQQEEAAQMLVSREIHSIDEYQQHAEASQNKKKKPTTPAEIIADIKRADKNYLVTSNDFLTEMRGVTDSYISGVAWFYTADYEGVFSSLTESDLAKLKQQVDSVCTCARKIYKFVERKATR